MTRSRPKLTFDIIDESFVLPVDSLIFGATKPILGCWAPDLHLLATQEELQSGYITETSNSNWFARVRTLTEQITGVTIGNDNYSSVIMNGYTNVGNTLGGAIGLLDGSYGTTYNIEKISGSSGASTTFGVTNKFRPNWWSVQNALQYGTTVYVGISGRGFTGELGPNGTAGDPSPYTTATDFAVPGLYNVIFQTYHQDIAGGTFAAAGSVGWSGPDWLQLTENANVIDIVNALKDSDSPVIGVVNVGLTGAADHTDKIGSLDANNEYVVQVAGDKYHLNSVAASTNASLIRTHLAPDVAGCIVNTPQVWNSPAGKTRGRILSVVRLARKFTTGAQDALYDSNVNPVITVPGSGTLLYGDITNAEDTSSFISINVIRTVIFIKTSLLTVAQEVLFELNNEKTRELFTLRADSILRRIKAAEGLTDFSIVCDASNNPQEIIDAKAFVADIKVKIPGSINYVNITLTNQ